MLPSEAKDEAALPFTVPFTRVQSLQTLTGKIVQMRFRARKSRLVTMPLSPAQCMTHDNSWPVVTTTSLELPRSTTRQVVVTWITMFKIRATVARLESRTTK